MKESNLGYVIPDVLLPTKGTDLSRWAVVACDQYTSEPEYWEKTEAIVGDAPSALRLMLPEAYLAEKGREEAIPETMRRYLAEGIVRTLPPGMIRLRRETTRGLRRGLLLALDLDAYDYSPNATSLIRATEATVEERLPARVRLRRQAALEMPHIMVLADDPLYRLDACLNPLEGTAPLYDFPLMQGGGRLTGWRVPGELEKPIESAFWEMLSAKGENPLLFAVGDGNHSLAAAKVFWEEIKGGIPAEARFGHPARYALAEIVNLHDPALVFEPIHRLVTGVEPEAFLERVAREIRELGADGSDEPDAHRIPCLTTRKVGTLTVSRRASPLALRVLQKALDAAVADVPGAAQDYIHGDAAARRLGEKPGSVALLLPPLEKGTLFDTIRRDGPLPRKCFSLGEAQDKRYYLECRRLTRGLEVKIWE